MNTAAVGSGKGFLYLLPLALAFTAAILAPLLIMMVISLFETNFIFTEFVGLGNYLSTFRDPRFLQALGNTLLYAALMVPAGTVLPLWAALTAHGMGKRLRNTVRMGLYFPVLASGIVTAGTWRLLFDYRKGLVNWVLGLGGVDPVAWWLQRSSAIPLISFIVVTSVWLGGMSAMYMAVLNSIPDELYQAARADGASWRQIQRHILIPSVMPTVGFGMMLQVVNVFGMWEHQLLLTDGGPDGGTATLAFNIFDTAFRQGQYGMGAARTVLLFLFTIGLALLREKTIRSFV